MFRIIKGPPIDSKIKSRLIIALCGFSMMAGSALLDTVMGIKVTILIDFIAWLVSAIAVVDGCAHSWEKYLKPRFGSRSDDRDGSG